MLNHGPFREPSKLPPSSAKFASVVCSCILLAASTGMHWFAPQSQKESTPSRPIYLPDVRPEASNLCLALFYLGEPSLLDAPKNLQTISFRASYYSPVPGHAVAVRLVVSSEGNGEITSAVSSGSYNDIKRTSNRIDADDVHQLFDLVQKAEFWSAASSEPPQKGYLMDGAWWMLEGVRNGQFHYVFRRNPTSDPVTEIGCYMAKDLVKTSGPSIPMAACASHRPLKPARANGSGSS